jgi:hypothetical protein
MIGRYRVGAQGWRTAVIPWAAGLACLIGVCGPTLADEPVDPVVAEVDLQRGIVAFQKGRYDEALTRLDGIRATVPGASYYRGLSLLGLKRNDDALREFESLRTMPGPHTEADLGVGVAQLALGDAKGAEAALGTYLKARPDDHYGHYMMGVALFQQGRSPDAREHFAIAKADANLSPYLAPYRDLVASVADDAVLPPLPATSPTASIVPPENNAPRVNFMNRMTAPPGGPGTIPGPGTTGVGGATTGAADPNRRWNLAIVNGYEYDTNVALAPSIALTGLGSLNQKIDSRYQLASFGEYRFIQREDLVAGLIGSTYDSFQFRLQQYNIQDYMGGMYSNLALGPKFILGGRYEFHDTLLGGNQFTTDHRVTPNLTYREGDFGHFTSFYEFEALDVKGLALIPAQRRTGNINAIGATQAIYLANGNGRLYLNYRYENAQTQGTDFDRNTHQLGVRLEYPLPGKMVLNTEFRQFFDNYNNPNSLDFLGHRRFDNRIEVRTGLQKFLNAHLSIRVDHVYTNNQSNVANLFGTSFYSYHRNTLATQLIYDF